jgi:transposase, IS5 family
MYRKSEQLTLNDFILPFGGHLSQENRWVQLAQLIPWSTIEVKYAALFPAKTGNVAKPVRIALGALIIKEKCQFSDEETVEQIKENPYLQYFIGLHEFQNQAPFDSSLMTHFRKRLGLETILEVIEQVSEPKLEVAASQTKVTVDTKFDEAANIEDPDIPRVGTLIIDATCAPADIHYPTDLNLLNEAREKLEEIIDTLYDYVRDQGKIPRTYRQVARKDYLQVAKQKKVIYKVLRKAIGKQLHYVARDLRSIEKLLNQGGKLQMLSKHQYRNLLVIGELYRQQKLMYDKKEHRVEDRIVSISQPHVRPIVRGKASAETEFGAKVSISLVDGYAFLDVLSWDNYNEGIRLKQAVELYLQRFKCYPAIVIGDQIYRNSDNRKYCKRFGISLSGPRLGRPLQDKKEEQRRLERQDASERNAVEGKFGEGKRRYGLSRVMAKLQETSETVIALQFLVMNLERRLRLLFLQIFKVLFPEFWEAEAV